LTVPPTSETYSLSLHDALPICIARDAAPLERDGRAGAAQHRPAVQRFDPPIAVDHAGAGLRTRFAATALEAAAVHRDGHRVGIEDRKSTRLNSSHVEISYAVFC